MNESELTLLTTEELAQKIRYDARTIRERLVDAVLIEGTHYVRAFGRRKMLFLWEPIRRDLLQQTNLKIPMANGGVCNG